MSARAGHRLPTRSAEDGKEGPGRGPRTAEEGPRRGRGGAGDGEEGPETGLGRAEEGPRRGALTFAAGASVRVSLRAANCLCKALISSFFCFSASSVAAFFWA